MPQQYSEILLSAATRLIMPWESLGSYTFPQKKEGIRALAQTLLDLAGPDLEHANEFSEMVRKGCPRCPTPIEMRRIWCTRWAPADGLSEIKADLSDYMTLPKPRKTE